MMVKEESMSMWRDVPTVYKRGEANKDLCYYLVIG